MMAQQAYESRNSGECKITFIIGNGFDLNLGMKTRYADIYDSYVNTPSQTAAIAAFKRDLHDHTRYDKWADFELGMAKYAKTLRDENEFIQCIRDFKVHMVKHLIMENEQICKKLFSANFEPGITFVLENALHEYQDAVQHRAAS